MKYIDLEKRVAQLEARNKKVEAEKAWEKSFARRGSIALLTYAVIVAYLYAIDVSKPWINAMVPVLGFVFSTLSLSLVKKQWLNRK